MGITIGSNVEHSWIIPVGDAVDPGAARTNQRAELLAAIGGLKKLEEAYPFEGHHGTIAAHPKQQQSQDAYIIVTDSEYVVNGITAWFPTWRVRLCCHAHYTYSFN